MTTNYVVAPREPVAEAVDEICADHEGRVYAFSFIPKGSLLFAAIPDDPNAPVLVERDEWERMKRDAERWRKWQDRRKEHIITKERGT